MSISDSVISALDNKLNLDDTFNFGCKGCGKCCIDRNDILLTPNDIYNIAKYLGRTIDEIINRYCDTLIGDSSRMPLVRLQSIGIDKRCPLLFDRRCIVHKFKPIVCALFPLGRAFTSSDYKTLNTEQPFYFVQNITCRGANTKTHTVRDWLELFNIPIDDEFHRIWTKAYIFLSNYLIQEEKKLTQNEMSLIRGGVYSLLYLNYDTNIDFLPQFTERFKRLKSIGQVIKK